MLQKDCDARSGVVSTSTCDVVHQVAACKKDLVGDEVVGVKARYLNNGGVPFDNASATKFCTESAGTPDIIGK
jgi:hypothetical protein